MQLTGFPYGVSQTKILNVVLRYALFIRHAIVRFRGLIPSTNSVARFPDKKFRNFHAMNKPSRPIVFDLQCPALMAIFLYDMELLI